MSNALIRKEFQMQSIKMSIIFFEYNFMQRAK